MLCVYLCVYLLVFTRTADCTTCSNGNVSVSYCTPDQEEEPPIGTSLKYTLTTSDDFVCPREKDSIQQWLLEIDTGPGVYCTAAFQNMSMCMSSNGTLRIFREYLPSNNSLLPISYVTSQQTYNVIIRYGPVGVFPVYNSTIEATENDKRLSLDFVVFYPVDFAVETSAFFNGEPTKITFNNKCGAQGSSDIRASIQFSTVSLRDAGNYTIQLDGGSNGSFSANIMLIVHYDPENTIDILSTIVPPNSSSLLTFLPTTTDTTTNTTTFLSTAMFSTRFVSVTAIPTTDVTTQSPSLFSNTIVRVVIGVAVFFLVVIIIIVVIVIILCCFKSQNVTTHSDIPFSDELVKNSLPVAKPRHNSASSERPLIKGESNASVATSTTDSMAHYTAVYCSAEFEECAVILKKKHGQLVKVLDNWEDVRLSIIQPSCNDILVFANPDDEVFREIISCGIDPQRPNERSKLRIIKFEPDDEVDVPTECIGVNGYKFVHVHGSPTDIDTLITAINKAEMPPMHSKPSPNNNTREREIELLEKIMNLQENNLKVNKNQLSVQQEILEQGRDVTGILETHLVEPTLTNETGTHLVEPTSTNETTI